MAPKIEPVALANSFVFRVDFNEHPECSCLLQAFCRVSRGRLRTPPVEAMASTPATCRRDGPLRHFLPVGPGRWLGLSGEQIPGNTHINLSNVLLGRWHMLAEDRAQRTGCVRLMEGCWRAACLTPSHPCANHGEVEQQMENSTKPFIGHMSLLSVGQQTKISANI